MSWIWGEVEPAHSEGLCSPQQRKHDPLPGEGATSSLGTIPLLGTPRDCGQDLGEEGSL